jgi:hypothetical protein
VNVYKMVGKDGQRNKRFLWRCRDCERQYTVRIGTVFEESRLPLRCWCYGFWAACSSKKGVSALQIKRQCQISYKAALFLLHRIRHAMAPANAAGAKLTGVCEADETYVGGKPRYRGPHNKRGHGTKKQPVFAVVERGGRVRTKVIADITGPTLKAAVREFVDGSAKLMTDENSSYIGLAPEFAGGHETVAHGAKEYVRGDIHTNTIEGFFSILKRGITGVYHNVSKRHLHRYLAEFEFRYNARHMNDGDRTVACIRAAEGKRLLYREPLG